MTTIDTSARIKQLEHQIQMLEGTATFVAAQLGVLSFLRLDELSGDTDQNGFENLLGHLAYELEESVAKSAEIRSAAVVQEQGDSQ